MVMKRQRPYYPPVGAAIFSATDTGPQPVAHKDLLFTKHVRAVAVMKRRRPPTSDRVRHFRTTAG